MASYRYKFLGKQHLPTRMTEDDVAEYCTLGAKQTAALPKPELVDVDKKRARGRPPLDLRLGYALQLVFLAMTGRQAGATDKFPPFIVSLLSKQLGVDSTAIATIKSIYRGSENARGSGERTITTQRTWAREALGFQLLNEGIEEELTAATAVRARDAATKAEGPQRSSVLASSFARRVRGLVRRNDTCGPE